MKLKSIHINGLWNIYNVDWKLNESVNILSGGNGSGKSTVFDIIYCLFAHPSHRLYDKLNAKVKEIKIETTEGKISYYNFRNTYTELKKLADKDEMYKPLMEEVALDFSHIKDKNKWNSIRIDASITKVSKGKSELEGEKKEAFFDKINFDVISTFDGIIMKEEGLPDEVETYMDQELYEISQKYSFYIGSLASKVEDAIKNDKVSFDYFTDVYSQKNLFASIINEFFAESNKEIVLDNNVPKFILKDNPETKLSMYDLSSGEKQILLIMLTVLLQEKNEYILFLDEPEISLHTDWQSLLIEKILQLNPNCQLLIATHAPSLIMNGWIPNVQCMEDLRTKI